MKTPKEIIESKGYKLYADDSVLEKVPRSDGKKKVEVFKLDRYMSNEEVAEEYKRRGLVPATFDEILSVEKDYDDIATMWDGNCYLAFLRWGVDRLVDCRRNDDDWSDDWFLSGVPAPRKYSDLESSDLPSESLSLDRALEIVKEAGYEVSEPSLAKKFQAFRAKHGKGSGDAYWDGLVVIAYEYFNKHK